MRILAVDDEKFARDALTEAIGEAAPDAELFACATPQEAVDHVRGQPCDAAFLDMQLRGTTGLALAVRLKNVCPQIRIFFVTGYDAYPSADTQQCGAGYLFKPVQAEQVQEALKHLREPDVPEQTGVYARTFGAFALYADGREIVFEMPEAKELLAFLIDKRGAHITNRQIEAVLCKTSGGLSAWAHQRKVRASLMHTLAAAGAGSICRAVGRCMWVDTAVLRCDCWQMLDGDVCALNRYRGEYLTGYQWAEPTRAALAGRSASRISAI